MRGLKTPSPPAIRYRPSGLPDGALKGAASAGEAGGMAQPLRPPH